MKKVLAAIAGILFAVFSIAILGLLMSLTFGALGKLFPGNFTNQLWGLVLFDIAAIIWALVFVFESKSTGQYAVAAIGFLSAFVGTLGMVAIEVMLSGQTYVEVEPWVGQWLVYGFVIMTAIHSALLYAHHAFAPDIHSKIDVGIARGEIVSEAIKQATQSLDVQKADLAQSIKQEIIDQVKRELGIARGQVLDLPALPVMDTANSSSIDANPKPGFSLTQLFPFLWSKNQGPRTYEAATVQSAPLQQPTNTPTPAPQGPILNDPTAVQEGTPAPAPAPFQSPEG